MDLQQIKYFLAVVDSGTFLGASKNVYVSQPTLSAGIKKLEVSLGVTLFNRGSRLATLTPAGEQFLAPARQAFNQLQLIKATLSEQPEKIVIGVLNNIHMDYVASIIGAHRTSHPHVLIELVVDSDEQLRQMLQVGKVDLIIVNSTTKAPGFHALTTERLCLVVPCGHPLAGSSSVTVTALEGEPFIERVNCSFWSQVDKAFQAAKLRPQKVMQAQSDEFVLSLVAANLGLSIVTARSTPYAVDFIPIKGLDIDRSIGICMTENSVAPHIQLFYNALIRQYSDD